MNAIGSIFDIIKEINLSQIKEKADQSFRIVVTGEPTLTRELAEELSTAPGKTGIHPWLLLAPTEARPQEWGVPVVAVVYITGETGGELADDPTALELAQGGIPSLTVVAHAAAPQTVGAELARRGENRRVLVAGLDAMTLQTKIAPCLVEVVGTDYQVALARQLPALRTALAQKLVEDTARANAIYAASTALGEVVPGLNLVLSAADILVLTKNQLVMAYKIALAAGKEGQPQEIIGEVVSVVGGGFLLRQIARELVGLIPVVGAIPKVAVAYAGTWVMGRTVTLWAMEGHRLNPNEARRFYDEAAQRGRAFAETVLARMRREPAALPAPEGTAGEVAVTVERQPGWWQRLRGRMRVPNFRPRAALPAPEGEGEGEGVRWWQRLPFFRKK